MSECKCKVGDFIIIYYAKMTFKALAYVKSIDLDIINYEIKGHFPNKDIKTQNEARLATDKEISIYVAKRMTTFNNSLL